MVCEATFYWRFYWILPVSWFDSLEWSWDYGKTLDISFLFAIALPSISWFHISLICRASAFRHPLWIIGPQLFHLFSSLVLTSNGFWSEWDVVCRQSYSSSLLLIACSISARQPYLKVFSGVTCRRLAIFLFSISPQPADRQFFPGLPLIFQFVACACRAASLWVRSLMPLSIMNTIWFAPSSVSLLRDALIFHLRVCTFLFLGQSFAFSLSPGCSSFSFIRTLASTSKTETLVILIVSLFISFWIEGFCFHIPAPYSWRKDWRWSFSAIQFRWRRAGWHCWTARWSFPMPACTSPLYSGCRTLSSGWTVLVRWFFLRMIGRQWLFPANFHSWVVRGWGGWMTTTHFPSLYEGTAVASFHSGLSDGPSLRFRADHSPSIMSD